MNLIPNAVHSYCNQHHYTEPFQHEGQWWAFPPAGVIPTPLPSDIDPIFAGIAQSILASNPRSGKSLHQRQRGDRP